jgi:hydrogenase-4 component F
MQTLLIISAIPVFLAVLSLLIADVKVTRKLVAVMHWVQLAVVTATFMPLLTGQQVLLNFVPGLLVDRIGACFVILTTFVSACCVTHADYFFMTEKQANEPANWLNYKIFYACVNAFLLSMTFVFFCDNLGYLWISVEASTLSSAWLVFVDRTKLALEASWKYLIICSVGIAFALLGTVFIFASSQHGSLAESSLCISDLINHAQDLNYSLLRLGFIFCLIGYGTKAGIVPLHSWMPDAYSESPAPACGMLSGALLNCALFGIWRVSQIVVACKPGSGTHELLSILGTISVVAASLLLVRQHSFKRMWAYSSIENVGLMLVAIGLGSGGLFLLQALCHSCSKVALFLLSGNIIQAAGTKRLHNLHGVLSSCPIWGFLLAMATFSVTGAPPFGAFVSEMAIITANANPTNWAIALALTAAITLTFIAICTHVGRILFGSPKATFEASQPLRAALVPGFLIIGNFLLGFLINIDFWMTLK